MLSATVATSTTTGRTAQCKVLLHVRFNGT
jgi:hypothetical protein